VAAPLDVPMLLGVQLAAVGHYAARLLAVGMTKVRLSCLPRA